MQIWKAQWGHDNGCDGIGVAYHTNQRDAERMAKARHDPAFDHVDPGAEKLHVAPTKASIIGLLNRETRPLADF